MPSKGPRSAILRVLDKLGQPVSVNNLIEGALVILPMVSSTLSYTRRKRVITAYEGLLANGILACRDGYVTQVRQARPSRHGYPWSPTEDKELVDSFVARVHADNIAAEHGRTSGAIKSRIAQLGLAELPELIAIRGARYFKRA